MRDSDLLDEMFDIDGLVDDVIGETFAAVVKERGLPERRDEFVVPERLRPSTAMGLMLTKLFMDTPPCEWV